MAKYVDGFVLIVPNNKTEEYKKMAEEGAEMWMKAGALMYYECKGDDLSVQEMDGMKHLGFPTMTKAKDDENVWFSFIVFKSKEHRDEVNARVMEEMNKLKDKYKDFPMPFDMSQMAYGGFEVVVEK